MASDDRKPALSALAEYTRINTDQQAQSLFALLGLVNVLTIVIFSLTAGLWYVVDRGRPADHEFALSFDERMLPLMGVEDPSFNTNAMLSWVDLAAAQIMTFGFNDINESFSASHSYFTDVGWQSFFVAL